jgi:hypothetical protein
MEVFVLGLIWDTLEGKVMMDYTYVYTCSVSWSKKIVTYLLSSVFSLHIIYF